jgi:hypothetical protein
MILVGVMPYLYVKTESSSKYELKNNIWNSIIEQNEGKVV